MDSSGRIIDGISQKEVVDVSTVDPFLVEALQNPRHRLTILRMELDIQRFLQNPEQQQFEFQHFPTSYLRLAAHRVAQHYSLQTMVQDNGLDGLGNKIVVRKTSESRYPPVRLSEIPAKQSENEMPECIKIAIRPRPSKASHAEGTELGAKRSPVRTVEERKEEYDRARARIFSSPGSPETEESLPQMPLDLKNPCSSRDGYEGFRNPMVDPEKSLGSRDGSTSARVAIFRDREKDRTDPDYDRSYDRYIRNSATNQTFGLAPFSMQKIQPAFLQYDPSFPQLGQLTRTQTSLGYAPSNTVINPFCSMGLNQTSGDAVYMQWPSHAMMYAQSYEQLRHNVFQMQAPFCQQPLSFDYSQNN